MLNSLSPLSKLLALILTCLCVLRLADAAGTGCPLPPTAILNLVDAPLSPLVSPNPAQMHLLILSLLTFSSISDVAQSELRLAGLRIQLRWFMPSRRRTRRHRFDGTQFRGSTISGRTRTLLVKALLENSSPAPVMPQVPDGSIVQEI